MLKKRYGYFDSGSREYVITEPLTPRPWVNYLTNNRLGAFVSQGAGGLAWYRQPISGRISRYDFMGLPQDRPGFYVYIRETDGTCWSPSYQPCRTKPDKWECRHGMGYTGFTAERAGIEAKLTFYVPLEDDVLLWDLTLQNNRTVPEKLFLSNYLEFSLYEYYKEILGWVVLRNQIRFRYDPEIEVVKYDYFVYEAEHTHPVFLSGSRSISGYDCNRDAFIGRGRDTSEPVAIERGKLGNTQLPGGGLGIGALSYDTVLQPGESARFIWVLGAAESWDQADALALKYRDPAQADRARERIGSHWEEILSTLQAEISDSYMQEMVNTWNPYGAGVTFFRDRDISPDLPGLNSGIRFRDAMQNCMSMCSLDPETARERIELLLSHRRNDGTALDAFLPGSAIAPQTEEVRCDNNVWSPMTVYQYLAETGDSVFLDKRLPYVDGGDDTVYDHLMSGLRQVVRDAGDNGLPLLKGRDWDDHLSLFAEDGAESVMTAQNWCYAARQMQEICFYHGRKEDAAWLNKELAKQAAALNDIAWDGEWYRQVIFRDGKIPLGSTQRRENKIYINTQSWAVISGTFAEGRAPLCMDKVREYLNTPYGIRFLYPAYTGIPEPEDELVSNGPGLGENGGVFIQANCWAIMAEAMLGRGDRACEYYRQIMPPVASESIGPDIYLNEPYMFSSHIVAQPDERRGTANLSWLTGTVNWMYIVATQHILGLQPTLQGLRIKPCIPDEWPGFKVRRRYRGAFYNIEVVNERTGQAPEIRFEGRRLEEDLLPVLSVGGEANLRIVI